MLPLTLGDQIGALLGAAAGQVAVADSTTVCFYKAASAALDARPGRLEIVTDRGNFPTDRYVLESLAAAARTAPALARAGRPNARPERRRRSRRVLSDETALVTFTHVDYRSAAILDMTAITQVAHDAGALTIWDLSHSVGSVPVALDAAGADLAVGCTYKYLFGGPGAPAFIYVRSELQASLRQPVWGWLGRRDPFRMDPGYEPAAGIRAFLSGTPPILALQRPRSGHRAGQRAGLDLIRAKGIALTELAIALADRWLAEHGVTRGLAARREDPRRACGARPPRRRGAVRTPRRSRRARRLPRARHRAPRALAADHTLRRGVGRRQRAARGPRRARGADSLAGEQEIADHAPRRGILEQEGVAAVEDLEPSTGDRAGERPRVLGRRQTVVAAGRDERRRA